MAEKWYPVIDYMLCEECGSCIAKCAHGTFDKDKAPTPVVVKPAACVDHCHGCGNLCPVGAITYVGEDTGWTPPKGVNDSADSEPCCGADTAGKNIQVDFLYLDLNTCERCGSTSDVLDNAIAEVSPVLVTLGYALSVNKVEIASPELARQHRFESSPTIRVNGKDICADVRENACKDCGDLCGSDVDCRVFEYEGEEYDAPPKAMIVDGILRAIYQPQACDCDSSYTMPENLKTFFAGKPAPCCEPGGCCCG